MSKSLERILEKYPELDTPLYKEAYRRQEEEIPPREVSALRRRLVKLFVLGGSGFAASFLAACQPAPAMVVEPSPTLQEDLDLVFSSPTKPIEELEQKPFPTVKPTVVPTEVPPTEIPPTPTEVPTSTPSLTPEPTKTFTPEPTPTLAPEVFGGRVMTKEELAYLSDLRGGEEMLALVDESLQEFPLLRPFLLMGAQAILSGQTGIVEVLPAAGEGKSWYVFRGTLPQEFSLINFLSEEEVSLRSDDHLTVIAQAPEEEFLVMYEQWQDGKVTYHFGITSREVQGILGNFKDKEKFWQPNVFEKEVWSQVKAAVKEEGVAEPAQVVILVEALNLRSGPGTNYEIIGSFKKSDMVEVIGQYKGWYQIVWRSKNGEENQGWVSGKSDYVQANEAAKNVPFILEKEIPSLPKPKLESPEFVLWEVMPDAQDLSLSCESSASAMVAAYFRPKPPDGYSSWEEYFIRVIPQNCNPHRGYRGKVDGWLSTSCDIEAGLGYGVYAEPVATAFQEAGIPAQVEYGVDYGAVERAIRAGKPVIVWISGRNEPTQYETDSETGQRYVLIEGEHAWTVVGVRGETSQRQFLINDPWKGRQYWVKGFSRWHDFNGMRVVVG